MSEHSSFEFGSEEDIHVGPIRSVTPRLNDSQDSCRVPEDEEGLVQVQKTLRPVLATRRLPILTSTTVNPDNYDLNQILDPKVESRAQYNSPQRNPKTMDFLKKNIADLKLMRGSQNRSTSASSRTMTPDLSEACKPIVREVSTELRECTFSPVINRSTSPKRSVTQYYESMRAFLQKKQENLDTKRAALASNASEPTFKPRISVRSQQMAQNRTGSVFTKLQSTHEVLIQETIAKRRESQLTLRSDVTATTRQAQREGSVTERLYSEARLRNSEPRIAPPENRSPSPSQNSVRIAFKKFKSELKQAAAGTPDLNNVSYLQLRLILECLHMLRSDSDNTLCYKVWSHLTAGKQPLDFSALKEFLFSVMNFKPLSPRTHSEFQTLYITRLSTASSHPEVTPLKSQNTTPAAQKEHMERLLHVSSVSTKKLAAAKLTQEQEILKSCTFTPSLVATVPKQRGITACDSLAADYQKLLHLSSQSRHSNLHKLATVIKERQLATKRTDKDDPECTFTPQVLKRRNRSQESKLSDNAVQAAERMTKAREESEWKEYCKTHGLNNSKVTQTEKRKQWSYSRKRSASMSSRTVE